jgi:selenide,water dikinase
MTKKEVIKLTSYSHGAGCGCKISPSVLSEILVAAGNDYRDDFPALLVGNTERDDAAVYDLGDGSALISTTDFFMPIVDDPEAFGKIAAANALSDIYAMGGHPLLAIAILGWPVDDIPHEVAGLVLRGAQRTCAEAGIPLAGGHSIDNPEPIFGLAVTGRVGVSHLKRNAGAQVSDLLYLTKPIGVGILATAQKMGKIVSGHEAAAQDSMARLNSAGAKFGTLAYVHAMTDVTGFGVGGHLLEMCEASGSGAELWFDQLPLIHGEYLREYIDAGCVPGGTGRNYASHSQSFNTMSDYARSIVFDPQTSGGLLVAIDPDAKGTFESLLKELGLSSWRVGKMTHAGSPEIIRVV